MTRHELKEQVQHDPFAEKVSEALTYASSHRSQVTRWIAIAAVVSILVALGLWYASYRRSVREADLAGAMAVVDAQVGPKNEFITTYATQDEKNAAAEKALTSVINKDGGTREGDLAQYYRGTIRAGKNDISGAESDLKAVAGSSSDAGALAKIALAQLYMASNRAAQARNLLQELVNKPTDLVSKSQAQILLAQLDQTTNPQESKRILQSLKKPGESPAVSRAAEQLSAQLGK